LKAMWNVQIAGDAVIHKVIMNICRCHRLNSKRGSCLSVWLLVV
jgi:hypothetical protein